MEEIKTAKKASVKTTQAVIISAMSITEKDLLQKAFSLYLDNFKSDSVIEGYCRAHGLDLSYLGLSNGEFHKTIPARHKSFSTLQKLGLITSGGKDKFKNHLVIPALDGVEVTALKFIDLSTIAKSKNLAISKEKILPVAENIFRVEINHRIYIIQGLMKSDHLLKATVKFSSGSGRHVDVINFYSSGNRKRFIEDICEEFLFPHNEIKSDVLRLLEICEKKPVPKKLSDNAKELLRKVGNDKFTTVDLKEILLWEPMPINRAVKELLEAGRITQLSKRKPFKYAVCK